MIDKAFGKVIHESQPFGFVKNHNMHGHFPGSPWTHNVPRGTTEVENRGMSAAISNADKNPQAYSRACEHRDNPFAFTGMPEKRSHNSYNARMVQTGDVS